MVQNGAAIDHDGRGQWLVREEGALEQLCSACRRINDQLTAGILTLRGPLAEEHKQEMSRLARHREEVDTQQYALNRIMSIEEDSVPDIHRPAAQEGVDARDKQ